MSPPSRRHDAADVLPRRHLWQGEGKRRKRLQATCVCNQLHKLVAALCNHHGAGHSTSGRTALACASMTASPSRPSCLVAHKSSALSFVRLLKAQRHRPSKRPVAARHDPCSLLGISLIRSRRFPDPVIQVPCSNSLFSARRRPSESKKTKIIKALWRLTVSGAAFFWRQQGFPRAAWPLLVAR